MALTTEAHKFGDKIQIQKFQSINIHIQIRINPLLPFKLRSRRVPLLVYLSVKDSCGFYVLMNDVNDRVLMSAFLA